MAIPKLKLIYLPVRARAEATRLALAHSKIPYEDVTIPFSEMAKYKVGPECPHGQLPVLEIDGKVRLPQSGAILRYVAKLANLVPTDPVQAALCDSIFELSQELTANKRNVNPIFNMFTGETLERKREDFFKEFPRYPPLFSKLLGEKKFFMGDTPMYCDFGVWHVLDNTRGLDPKALDGYDNLLAWMERVAKLPGVEEYLRARPPPEQLGRNLLAGMDFGKRP